MPADRFYSEKPLSMGASIAIEGPEHHHLRVMRIAPGEEVELIDGQGSLASAKLTHIDKHSATFHILQVETAPPPSAQIILAIPLMRPSKLELIVEKGTELGADRFLFYPAAHSEKSDLSSNQLDRLHHLILSALKQSGRLYLPGIEILTKLEEILRIDAQLLFGDTRPDATSLVKKGNKTVLITGPEKGFSPKEVELLQTKAQGVKLNPHILRAETAPLAGVSILAMI